MATATKKAPAKKTPEKGTLDYLELALDDLNKARETAQKGARGQIDAALGWVRSSISDAKAELTTRTGHGH
jgi:hypothetical protein